MITIFHGDDTSFKGDKLIRVNLDSAISLVGCSAEFELCGIVRRIPDISTGTFYVNYAASETAKMPLGTHTAVIRAYDGEGHCRTIENAVRIKVTDRVDDAYRRESTLNVSVGSSVEWRDVRNKPSINGVVLDGNKTSQELQIKGVAKADLIDLPADYSPDELRNCINAIQACLRASMSAVVAVATLVPLFCPGATNLNSRVKYERFGSYRASSNVVSGVDLDGLATAEELEEVKELIALDPRYIDDYTSTGAVRDIIAEYGFDENTTSATNDLSRKLLGEIVAATNAIRRVDGAARVLPKYLHALDFADTYPADAAWYYAQPQPYGACSAVRDGDKLYRNYDWKFDDAAEFVVRVCCSSSRFASVGVANCGTNLTEEIVTSGKWSRYYKCLPGRTVDGINENGVVCEVNVVDGTPPRRLGGDIHPMGAVRWALDNGTSAGMVASNLAARIQFPAGWTQNFHWMVADADETWIVENGTASNLTGRVVMTNFPRLSMEYGAGWERYMLLEDAFANITNAWYTRAYARDTEWVSEFKDINEMEAAKSAWETYGKERLRGKGLWQTVHTSIYDLTHKTLRVAVQEEDDWYTFAVPTAGGIEEEIDPTVAWWARAGMPEPMTDLTPATNYTDAATNAIYTASTNYTDAATNALGVALRGEIAAHAPGNYETVSNLAMNALQAHQSLEPVTNYTDAVAKTKQDALPYETNAIPAEVIANAPWLTEHQSLSPATNYTDAATNALAAIIPGAYVPSAEDEAFSNAVLAVGLNIDTNTVALLNEIAATFGDFPIEGTAATIGGLLMALAAAVAWLKRKTADIETAVGTANADLETALDGEEA